MNGKKTKAARSAPEVSVKDFVVAWQGSSSLAEVEQKTGIRAAIAAARASMYRKKGIDLKYYAPGRKEKIDVDGLNELIRSMGGEVGKKPPKPKTEDPEVTLAKTEAADKTNRELLKRLLNA